MPQPEQEEFETKTTCVAAPEPGTPAKTLAQISRESSLPDTGYKINARELVRLSQLNDRELVKSLSEDHKISVFEVRSNASFELKFDSSSQKIERTRIDQRKFEAYKEFLAASEKRDGTGTGALFIPPVLQNKFSGGVYVSDTPVILFNGAAVSEDGTKLTQRPYIIHEVTHYLIDSMNRTPTVNSQSGEKVHPLSARVAELKEIRDNVLGLLRDKDNFFTSKLEDSVFECRSKELENSLRAEREHTSLHRLTHELRRELGLSSDQVLDNYNRWSKALGDARNHIDYLRNQALDGTAAYLRPEGIQRLEKLYATAMKNLEEGEQTAMNSYQEVPYCKVEITTKPGAKAKIR